MPYNYNVCSRTHSTPVPTRLHAHNSTTRVGSECLGVQLAKGRALFLRLAVRIAQRFLAQKTAELLVDVHLFRLVFCSFLFQKPFGCFVGTAVELERLRQGVVHALLWQMQNNNTQRIGWVKPKSSSTHKFCVNSKSWGNSISALELKDVASWCGLVNTQILHF